VISDFPACVTLPGREIRNQVPLIKPTFLRKLLPLFLLFPLLSHAQYWQQEVNYRIDVSLDDRMHSLKGFETIDYINNSPDTLLFIWIHLWPNAYKNDQTAFSDQLLENGNTEFYFSSDDQKGYINQLDFRMDGKPLNVEDHPNYQDIVKILLPEPLLPGGRTTITTPFHVRLPYNFSRGGHDGQSYQATQWYPRPAIYDQDGWHPMPYLDQGEFYNDFGSFDVKITVPSNYVVAATGELQNADERAWLMEKARMDKSSARFPDSFPPSHADIKILHYKQDRVHDFAWFADKRFLVSHDTAVLSPGKVIDVFSFYTPRELGTWTSSIPVAKEAIQHYSHLVGEYPYKTVSVVQGPKSFGGGMEYPLITVISPGLTREELENTIVHEIGHNWFQGILATNERRNPWMDEGMNTYYENLWQRTKGRRPGQDQKLISATTAALRLDQPISTSSEKFSEINYYSTAYHKAAVWMEWLESEMGSEEFHRGMKAYYDRWKFRHPDPYDLQSVLEESSGRDLDSQFAKLHTTGLLPNQETTGTRFQFSLDPKGPERYGKQPVKNLLLFGPAIGYNKYDGAQLGGFITNVKFPPNRFNFFLSALYGKSSGDVGGIGSASYMFYTGGWIRSIRLHVNAARFNVDAFEGFGQPERELGMFKISPDLKFTFRNKDARSRQNNYIQLKSYFIREEFLSFYRDTVVSGMDTTISQKYRSREESRDIHFIRVVMENHRALYPYRGELKLETGKDFYRLGFTGNYFFNYPKEGGLDVRLFAGKFLYKGSRTFAKRFATDRYHLNLTGANGYEDYTYSDYFIGRNEFEGFSSQQIMVRDGAFKVRTDLLAAKVGRTDDWLAAINFTTTIPPAINPLSVLPVKIPLKIFADVGTYAETWEEDAETDRFLFDAGLQVSFLFDMVNVYFPLVYSRVFKDYFQSTIPKKGRFWKTVSFSINVSGFDARQIDRRIVF
jgi:hypothetical protein